MRLFLTFFCISCKRTLLGLGHLSPWFSGYSDISDDTVFKLSWINGENSSYFLDMTGRSVFFKCPSYHLMDGRLLEYWGICVSRWSRQYLWMSVRVFVRKIIEIKLVRLRVKVLLKYKNIRLYNIFVYPNILMLFVMRLKYLKTI